MTPTEPARTTATWPAWPCCLAGLPVTVPGATVNRLCGSGWRRSSRPAAAVAVGDAAVVLTGGVESMTRAPWVLLKPDRAYPTSHEQLWSSTLGWRMVNPRMPAEWTISLGEGAEVLADKYGISREAQDAFAVAVAPAGRRRPGRRAGSMPRSSPCPAPTSQRDECIRPGQRLERLATAEAGVPLRGHGDGRQRVAAERRRGGRPPRLAKPGARRWEPTPLARVVAPGDQLASSRRSTASGR